MKKFVLLGNPVKHSLGPVLYAELFRQLEIEASYEIRLLIIEQIPDMMEELRSGVLTGANVTIPLKTKIVPHLDELTDVARAVGAVNCLSHTNGLIIGHNTDVDGIAFAFERARINLTGQNVLVLGAGGAARAAIHHCLASGVNLLAIAARNIDQATALAGSLGGNISVHTLKFDDTLETSPYDIIIHATPIGMWPKTDRSLLQQSQLHDRQVVFDVVYNPCQTHLLQLAQKQGCKVIQGLDMFIGQGLASLLIWFDSEADKSADLHQRLDMAALKSTLHHALERQFPLPSVTQDTQK